MIIHQSTSLSSSSLSIWSRSLSWAHRIILFIAVSIGVRIYLFSRPCSNDPVVGVIVDSKTISIRPCDVFSESYQEARSSFRQLVQNLGLAVDSLVVVEDSDYTMDIAVIPGSLPGLVVHTSGVHGVEGFAGSAIQLAFLQQLSREHQTKQSTFLEPLPGTPTVILVHAVNPFGMARYRRANENNVDLNRNALDDDVLQTLAVSHKNHENYQKFNDLFNPPKMNPFYAYFGFWIHALFLLWQNGYYALKAAMVGGQYYQPVGIFYGGGVSKQKSIRLLEQWLQNFLVTNFNGYDDDDKAPIVTWVDVHTGLGAMGVDTALVTTSISNVVAELTQWFPKKLGNKEQIDQSVGKGYEQSMGLITVYFNDKLFRDPKYQAFFLVQEFGTVPAILVAHALIQENAAHFSTTLAIEEKIAKAKQFTGRAFYPQSPAWRKSILERGIRVLYQAMARSSSSSQHNTKPIAAATSLEPQKDNHKFIETKNLLS